MTSEKVPKFKTCKITHLSYSASCFPKICSTCGKSYETHEIFVEETTALDAGSYGYGLDETFTEYRNCSCGSTLTCRLESRRDLSEKGEEYRSKFNLMLKKMLDNGIEEKDALKYLRDKFKNIKK